MNALKTPLKVVWTFKGAFSFCQELHSGGEVYWPDMPRESRVQKVQQVGWELDQSAVSKHFNRKNWVEGRSMVWKVDQQQGELQPEEISQAKFIQEFGGE